MTRQDRAKLQTALEPLLTGNSVMVPGFMQPGAFGRVGVNLAVVASVKQTRTLSAPPVIAGARMPPVLSATRATGFHGT